MLFWLQFEVDGNDAAPVELLSYHENVLNDAMLPDTADVKAMLLGETGPSGGSGHRRARAVAGSSIVGGQRTRSKGRLGFQFGDDRGWTNSRKGLP